MDIVGWPPDWALGTQPNGNSVVRKKNKKKEQKVHFP